MTVKEKLLAKLAELEDVKEKLLKIEPFLNPDNNMFIYHTEDIRSLAGTQGSTPSNLGEIMDVVVKAINEYVEYIKGLPEASSNIVFRDRLDKDMAIVSTERAGFHPPVSWTKEFSGVNTESVYSTLPMSTYYGRIIEAHVYSSPHINKNDYSGREISLEAKLIRINSRLNELNVFRSGADNPLDVLLTDDVMQPDDIYIIGVVPHERLSRDIIYYQNLSYTIDFKYADGSRETKLFAMGNRKDGNFLYDGDDTLEFGMVFWDMVIISGFNISVENYVGDRTDIDTSRNGNIGSAMFDSNIITKVVTHGFSTDISDEKVSYRSGCGYLRDIFSDTFDVYNKNTTPIARVVFKNVRPIDLVLEEAINEL